MCFFKIINFIIFEKRCTNQNNKQKNISFKIKPIYIKNTRRKIIMIDDHIRVSISNDCEIKYTFIKTKKLDFSNDYFYPIVRKDSNENIVCKYGFFYNGEMRGDVNINEVGTVFYQRDLKLYSREELDLFLNLKPIRGNIILEKFGKNDEFESIQHEDITCILNEIKK